jgi:cyclohexanecarboxylate-CoA ligase/acyl-CoA synthetase
MNDPWVPSVADRHDEVHVKSFYDSGIWRTEVLSDLLDRWCAQRPRKVAVSDGQGELTYAELRGQAYRLAAALRRLGVEAGDRVVMQLPNWCEFIVTYAALARIGAVLVPVGMYYRHDEVAYIAGESAAKGIVTTGVFRKFDHLSMAREIRSECPSLEFVVAARSEPGPGEHAFAELARPEAGTEVPDAAELGPPPSPDAGHICMFTSGTESRPKGCFHTFNTFRTSLQFLIQALGATESDVAFMASPLSHAVGMVFGLGVPLLSGSSTHLLDIWDPEVGLRRIQEYRCTSTASATPFLQMALDVYDPERHDLSSLRTWTCGGAPIPPTIVDRMGGAWPRCRLLSLYGRSEVFVSTMLSVDDPAEWALTSDGHPPPWVELGVFDVDGGSLPPGTEGEIAQRSPGSMLGYWNDPKRTADAFDREGWCRSGDLGRIDELGCLRVTGRLKDIIIRGGLNLSAREVEDNLITHPNVKDVAVVAMPDPVLGERACAFVVPAGLPPTLNDLAVYLRDERRVSPTKLPERLEIVEALPITATGKVQKFELRDRVRRLIEAEQSSLAEPASPRP